MAARSSGVTIGGGLNPGGIPSGLEVTKQAHSNAKARGGSQHRMRAPFVPWVSLSGSI